jgi:hypothetical protein
MITGMSGGNRVPTQQAISLAALRVHARGLLASFEGGHAGFVPDEYLTASGPETAAAVVELCDYGVWRPIDGGYAVASSEALRMACEVHREARRARPVRE